MVVVLVVRGSGAGGCVGGCVLGVGWGGVCVWWGGVWVGGSGSGGGGVGGGGGGGRDKRLIVSHLYLYASTCKGLASPLTTLW